MFSSFIQAFEQDPISKLVSHSVVSPTSDTVTALTTSFGGASFDHGLYRIVARDKQAIFDEYIFSAFPSSREDSKSFAYDWLGRVFAVSTNGKKIRMFEPGTGEVLALDESIEEFHESLSQYKEESLAQGFFQEWLLSGGAAPLQDQCIGYKRPLFLGGLDTLDNLELSNMDVYWSVMSQAISKYLGVK